MRENEQQRRSGRQQRNSWLEWLASGIGLLLSVGGIGYLLWNGTTTDGRPPAIQVEAERIVERNPGYTVEIRATNSSPSTAGTVVVEGALKRDGQTVEASQTTFNFIPGGAAARGGLYFSHDPRKLELDLRAMGYIRP